MSIYQIFFLNQINKKNHDFFSTLLKWFAFADIKDMHTSQDSSTIVHTMMCQIIKSLSFHSNFMTYIVFEASNIVS